MFVRDFFSFLNLGGRMSSNGFPVVSLMNLLSFFEMGVQFLLLLDFLITHIEVCLIDRDTFFYLNL